MTIQVDISGQGALEELVALIEGGEELVLLTRDGQLVAVARPPEAAPEPAVDMPAETGREQGERVLGLFAHLGPMEDPDIFFHPDSEFLELAESRDEDEFYRPLTPET